MAYTPPNRSGTQSGQVPVKKAKHHKPSSGGSGGSSAGTGKYQWGTGGKVHNIPQATHEQNVAAKKALGGTLDLTAPPNGAQAVREATSAADLQYGPQVQQAQQLQANVAPWFHDYLARVAGYAQAAQTLNAPVLQQAQAYQQGAAGQTAPGLDPNSAAGQQSAQAAQGRQALSQLGLDALNTNAQATQDFFGGQQNEAARVQPQVAAAAGQQVANAQSQRGAALQGFLTTARQNAQNYAIARGTLNLNTDKAAADTSLARGVDPVTGKKLPAKPATTKSSGAFAGMTDAQINGLSDTERQKKIDAYNKSQHTGSGSDPAVKPNKYGIPEGQWDHWSTSHRQRVIDAFNEKGASGAKDKEAAKHAGDVHAATGKVENTIKDITDRWDTFAKTGQVDDTTKPINDTSGKKPNTTGWKPTYAQRKPTPDEIKSQIGAGNKDWTPQMIHIALLRRAKPPKPLDQASIDYLHNSDPNFRIPRDWLPGDHRKGVTQPLNRGSGDNPPSKTGA